MKSLEELFKTPRMAFQPLDDNNSVAGLWEMLISIDENIYAYTRYLALNIIVEVGSYAGVSADLFARYCKNLFCVDIWNFKEGQGMSADIVEKAWREFNVMLDHHNNIETLIMHSVDAAKEFNNDSIDLVYIDAKHDYKEVQQDIRAWFPKVKPGGYLSGHDIHMDGVRQAVEEMFGTNYKTHKDTSWIIKK